MAADLLLPSEIVLEGQMRLATGDIRGTMNWAQAQLDAYYDHRPASHLPTKREVSPRRASIAIDRTLGALPLGVMQRAAVFNALDFAMTAGTRAEQDLILGSQPISYEHNNSLPYWPGSGEDRFLTAIVRRLDYGLAKFYEQDALAGELMNAYRPIHERLYGLAEGDPNLFGIRHFAEIPMLITREVPICIDLAYEDAEVTPPQIRLVELQSILVCAAYGLSALAGTHSKAPFDPALKSKPKHKTLHDIDLIECTLADGLITDVGWKHSRWGSLGKAGRCPGASALPALSRQQRSSIAALGLLTRNCSRLTAPHLRAIATSRDDNELSTSNAMLILAAFEAPLLWSEEMEAHRLCSDLAERDMWRARTLHDMSVSPASPG